MAPLQWRTSVMATSATCVRLRAKDFIGYDECLNALAAHYQGDILKRRAGNLWGSLCVGAKARRLPLEARCGWCGAELQDTGIVGKGMLCSHFDGSFGWRRVLITRTSLRNNPDIASALKKALPRQDYPLFVSAL